MTASRKLLIAGSTAAIGLDTAVGSGSCASRPASSSRWRGARSAVDDRHEPARIELVPAIPAGAGLERPTTR